MSDQLDGNQIHVLSGLAARAAGPVLDLPYTPEFDNLYDGFLKICGPGVTRHQVWLALLEVERGAGKSDGQKPVMSSEPSVPTPLAAAPHSQPLLHLAHGHIPVPPTNVQSLMFDLQPWDLKPSPQLPGNAEAERQALLASLEGTALVKTEQRVAKILQRYPETRESDTALAIRYWSMFQADVLEQWQPLELDVLFELDRIETISRVRRHIQNDLQLFVASQYTRVLRKEIQTEFNQYLAAERPVGPEIRFYLDETGNEQGKAYLGVAGICAMNWRQYAKHWSGLDRWRSEQGWPETIRFADSGTAMQPKALELLAALQQRQSGLLFVGYAMTSRGHTYELMLGLFIQVVMDSLRHMNMLGCLGTSRLLTVVKEAESGFDALYLAAMTKSLADQVAREFPEQVVMGEVVSLPKGREVMLECADLVAGGMQRRARYGGRNPKDVLAEAVFNVTGFEDPRDNGIVFRAYPTN